MQRLARRRRTKLARALEQVAYLLRIRGFPFVRGGFQQPNRRPVRIIRQRRVRIAPTRLRIGAFGVVELVAGVVKVSRVVELVIIARNEFVVITLVLVLSAWPSVKLTSAPLTKSSTFSFRFNSFDLASN